MSQIAKFMLMLVSFSLSVILWVYVQVQENPLQSPKTSYQLPVELKGLPEGLVVVDYPKTITAFPSGPVEERRLIDEKGLSAVIDLQAATPQNAKYRVIILSKGDFAAHWNPLTAVVKVDEQVHESKAVQVKSGGELQNRNSLFLPDSTYTEPQTVMVTGPKSIVSKVTAWVELELSDAQPGRDEATVNLEVDSASAPSSVTCEPQKVRIHPAIVVGAAARTLHVTPNFKGLPAPGFEIKSIEVTPENIELRGSAELLAPLLFLKTQSIDLSGLKQSATFPAIPELPKDVVYSNPQQQISVRVVIVPVAPPVQIKPVPEVKPRTHRRRSGG